MRRPDGDLGKPLTRILFSCSIFLLLETILKQLESVLFCCVSVSNFPSRFLLCSEVHFLLSFLVYHYKKKKILKYLENLIFYVKNILPGTLFLRNLFRSYHDSMTLFFQIPKIVLFPHHHSLVRT